MKLRALCTLVALLAACASPTSPTSSEPPAAAGPCWCCQWFPIGGGYTLEYCAKFNPCPSDSVLRATGWQRVDR